MERLLDGQVPRLMVTDPPYGVEYDPAWRNAAGVSSTKRTGKVTNDDRVDWTEVWRLFPGDVAYVWHAGRHCGEVAANLHEAELEIRAQIIWAKSRFALSRGNYHWQHEPCWYGSKAYWIGDRKQSTIWAIEVSDDGDATKHGTQKPLECMGRPMRHHDAPLVLDPFLGSGTTLIAAEQLDRTCYGLEIDPGYCDVIAGRWEKLTGGTVERIPASDNAGAQTEASHAG
jgi:DNA modification methylase